MVVCLNYVTCEDLRPYAAITTKRYASFACAGLLVCHQQQSQCGVITWVMIFVTCIPLTC